MGKEFYGRYSSEESEAILLFKLAPCTNQNSGKHRSIVIRINLCGYSKTEIGFPVCGALWTCSKDYLNNILLLADLRQ